MSAETRFEHIGLRMPDMLKSLLRRLFTHAYQAGVEAQREIIMLELETTAEGRAVLSRADVTRPHRPR